MTRDIEDRMKMFHADVEVRRLALNADQVRHYNLPPNPAKRTDSRHGAYIRDHGRESWELDALDPNVIVGLIETNIVALLDATKWTAAVMRQDEARALLRGTAQNWSKVVDVVGKNGGAS